MLDFIDVLVRRDRLTIGDKGPLRGACEVGDEEAYRWIKFARTPFNFGDYPARFGATGGPAAGDCLLQHIAAAMGAVDVAGRRTQRFRARN